MVKQASNVWKHLRRFLTADPGRFAGGSAVIEPLGLLAVERERLAALRSPQHDGSSQAAATANQGASSYGSPQAAATANQGTRPGPSGDVTGPWNATLIASRPGRARHDIRRLREEAQDSTLIALRSATGATLIAATVLASMVASLDANVIKVAARGR